jgi:hypothetical protein
LCPFSVAFVPSSQPRFAGVSVKAALANEVDAVGNNVKVKNLLQKVESQQLLSKVAASGLLSKAQKAGISLSKLEPLLALAVDNPDILILVEASGPDLLAILPNIVDIAPGALPLLAGAVSVPPLFLQAAGLGVLGAAGFAVFSIPDDSVVNVALQTVAVGLALPAAVAALAGGTVLSKLTK